MWEFSTVLNFCVQMILPVTFHYMRVWLRKHYSTDIAVIKCRNSYCRIVKRGGGEFLWMFCSNTKQMNIRRASTWSSQCAARKMVEMKFYYVVGKLMSTIFISNSLKERIEMHMIEAPCDCPALLSYYRHVNSTRSHRGNGEILMRDTFLYERKRQLYGYVPPPPKGLECTLNVPEILLIRQFQRSATLRIFLTNSLLPNNSLLWN
jgi:hypothetical protein